MGQGARPVTGGRLLEGRAGGFAWKLASEELPDPRCVLLAVGGGWVVVFSGASPVLVRDVAEAWLAQEAVP